MNFSLVQRRRLPGSSKKGDLNKNSVSGYEKRPKRGGGSARRVEIKKIRIYCFSDNLRRDT